MPHVTFIHGISNKPAQDRLVRSWVAALADDEGIDLDYEQITYEMAYWADLLYAEPLADRTANEGLEAVDLAGAQDVDMSWTASADAEELQVVTGLAAAVGLHLAAEEALVAPPGDGSAQQERLPAPVARRLMKTFVRDVHHYLYNTTFSPRPGEEYRIRDAVRERVLDVLRRGAQQEPPHLLLTHSMGTVIAYDCLRRVPGCPAVDALITVGTPLGLDDVQHLLTPEWSRDGGFPAADVLRGRWTNVYDRLDVVAAADPAIAGDFQRDGRPVVIDVHEPNWGRWRHDIGKYLRGRRLRAAVADALALPWSP